MKMMAGFRLWEHKNQYKKISCLSCVNDNSSSSFWVLSSLYVIGIPGLQSKIGYYLVISGCFSLVTRSFNLYTTVSFMGSSVHMKAWICFLMDRYIK